jgi:hypothetical protein
VLTLLLVSICKLHLITITNYLWTSHCYHHIALALLFVCTLQPIAIVKQ